ncbi:MAG: OmpA family protein [Planctomycetes bacterium]|nr:OmpA family protein [Planctomycetota bacterium]
MSTYRILAASLAVIVSLHLVGCGNRDLNYKTVETEELKKEIRDLEAQLDACEKRKVSGIYDSAPDHATARTRALTGVEQRDEKMQHVLSIESNVLFAPGSAKLTSEAKATLSRVIAVIQKDYPNHWVRIDGHTDNANITRSKDKWDDNWDLSGGRAQAVLHYLLDHGIPSKELGFAGFGQERPRGPNSSDAAKSKNRRVEIVVIPKE